MWKRREHFVYSKYTWKKEKNLSFHLKGLKGCCCGLKHQIWVPTLCPSQDHTMSQGEKEGSALVGN